MSSSERLAWRPALDRAAPATFVPLADPRGDVVFQPLADTGLAGDEREAPVPAPEAEDALKGAFRAGYEQARSAAQGELEALAESLGRALRELAAFRAGLRARYERELLEVALGVARKVLQQELVARPEIWLGMIREAVRRAVDREEIVVRVPPALAAFLRDRLPALQASLDEVKGLEVVEDPALPPGGCVVESRFGDVDVGLDTQLEAARAALVRAEE